PSGLTTAAGSAQVSLSWQAPSSDGGAAVTSYNVYQGGKRAATVSGTGATVKNLANGTTYSFTVTAVNKAGEGPASGAASATPAAAVTKPGAPNGLSASPGNGKVTLSWTAPKSTGGAAITSYNVYQGGKKAATVSGTGATVKNLANGTTYSFTVTAVNKAGEGAASGSASAMPSGASASGSASASTSGSASSSGSATPAAGAGASGPSTGSAGPASTSGQPTGTAVLASATKKVPKPLLFTLAALALAGIGGALTLTTRRVRKGRRQKRPPGAPPADVRAVPELGPPSPVSVRAFSVEKHELSAENHEVVMEETYVVRLEPLPAAIITTLEEIGV
ncbi:MAG TPA: fibronectin type III domain-containing protein, partial [Streptosporangiaceae bacterium]|nr:fibronectin type III domain-containing protein [Streptosporangiaceae bacterium]